MDHQQHLTEEERRAGWRRALRIPINELVDSQRPYLDELVDRAMAYADLERLAKEERK